MYSIETLHIERKRTIAVASLDQKVDGMVEWLVALGILEPRRALAKSFDP